MHEARLGEHCVPRAAIAFDITDLDHSLHFQGETVICFNRSKINKKLTTQKI